MDEARRLHMVEGVVLKMWAAADAAEALANLLCEQRLLEEEGPGLIFRDEALPDGSVVGMLADEATHASLHRERAAELQRKSREVWADARTAVSQALDQFTNDVFAALTSLVPAPEQHAIALRQSLGDLFGPLDGPVTSETIGEAVRRIRELVGPLAAWIDIKRRSRGSFSRPECALMTVDDLIAGFTELQSYQGARFEWNATIQLDTSSPLPDSHIIRLVPGYGVSGAFGQFKMLLEAAAEIVPSAEGNPGSTPTERFIVTVFREAGHMIDLERGPFRTLPIGREGDAAGNQWRVRIESSTISDPARACVMVLRKLRSQIEANRTAFEAAPATESKTRGQRTQPRRQRRIMEAKALTDRQRQAVELADAGHGPTAIAAQLGITKSSAARLRDDGRKKLAALQAAIRAPGRSVRPKAGLHDVQFHERDGD